MPATYDIDHKRRLVSSRFWGAVSDNEINEHNNELRNDPQFDPSYRQIVDLTGITELKVSTGIITETSLDQFFNPGTRRAMVAASDATFGLARMYALRAEGLGQTIEVFRDCPPAEEWLGI